MSNSIIGEFEGHLAREGLPLDPALALMADAHRNLEKGAEAGAMMPGFLEDLPLDLCGVASQAMSGKGWVSTRPGIEFLLLDVPGSQICEQGGSVMIVRMAPGIEGRPHRHIGEEFNLVLEGAIVASRGEKTRGDLVHNKPGSVHKAQACKDTGCVAFSITTGPLEDVGEELLVLQA